jgi:glycosyltransferase involved in cell wall biosynthesis
MVCVMQGNVLIEPEASIIIRTFNEEKHIQALLDALAIQSYTNFETILVDSGSLDRTREIAEGQVDTLLRIDSQDFTFGYSLNVGIQVAKGRFAVIVSAHTLPLKVLTTIGYLAVMYELKLLQQISPLPLEYLHLKSIQM